ncbi:hypothetical protein [Apilactobacillus micheneri]|uniref:hypothetical protein n=1 Tax=Apilactobacillus micheneri TaxID=1899430 RepID=UPI000D03F048|nr:hypothetical protein [Apilactobacillus micheneri]
MEQKYNVIIGMSFDGRYIAYNKDDSIEYDISYVDEEDLGSNDKLIFNEDELNNLYDFIENDYSKDYAKRYTFKIGQSSLIKNPFKK